MKNLAFLVVGTMFLCLPCLADDEDFGDDYDGYYQGSYGSNTINAYNRNGYTTGRIGNQDINLYSRNGYTTGRIGNQNVNTYEYRRNQTSPRVYPK